jgi:hypothetical protein
MGPHALMAAGQPLAFDAKAASGYLREKGEAHGTVRIELSVGKGAFSAEAWGCVARVAAWLDVLGLTSLLADVTCPTSTWRSTPTTQPRNTQLDVYTYIQTHARTSFSEHSGRTTAPLRRAKVKRRQAS